MSDFKKFTDNFVTEVANVATYLGDKAGKMVDYTKTRITISNQEVIVDNLYKKLGKFYFEKFRQGEAIDAPLFDDCKMIEMYLKSIEAMKDDSNTK